MVSQLPDECLAFLPYYVERVRWQHMTICVHKLILRTGDSCMMTYFRKWVCDCESLNSCFKANRLRTTGKKRKRDLPWGAANVKADHLTTRAAVREISTTAQWVRYTAPAWCSHFSSSLWYQSPVVSKQTSGFYNILCVLSSQNNFVNKSFYKFLLRDTLI